MKCKFMYIYAVMPYGQRAAQVCAVAKGHADNFGTHFDTDNFGRRLLWPSRNLILPAAAPPPPLLLY